MHDVTADTVDLLDRYVAAWNEAEPGRRRAEVARLYADDARLATPSLEVRGGETILEHIGEVFNEFIGLSGRRFRRTASTRHHGGFLLHWELVADGQPVAASGFTVLLLGPDGRVQEDHQFDEPRTNAEAADA
jgi:uncharacterized protein